MVLQLVGEDRIVTSHYKDKGKVSGRVKTKKEYTSSDTAQASYKQF